MLVNDADSLDLWALLLVGGANSGASSNPSDRACLSTSRWYRCAYCCNGFSARLTDPLQYWSVLLPLFPRLYELGAGVDATGRVGRRVGGAQEAMLAKSRWTRAWISFEPLAPSPRRAAVSAPRLRRRWRHAPRRERESRPGALRCRVRGTIRQRNHLMPGFIPRPPHSKTIGDSAERAPPLPNRWRAQPG